MIKKAGGQLKWMSLPDVKKAERTAAMIEDAVSELGKEVFNNLPDEEKCILQLVIWAGCGCHKDLNTVWGGYLAMITWWNDNESKNVDPPVLLANHDNDPVVQEQVAALAQVDIPTPAQEWAFHKSTHGAVKAAEIAGAIFSITKMTKKATMMSFIIGGGNMLGFHSHFLIHPIISSNLTVMLQQLSFFMQMNSKSLHVNKQNSTLNHMESNLWKALHCTSTTTDLLCLQFMQKPFHIHIWKQFVLPVTKIRICLTMALFTHMSMIICKKFIEKPDILIGKDIDPSKSFKTATLNGEQWQNIEVVNKILKLIPTLPHFHNLLILFF